MAQSGLWFSRSERHNYLAGIQEFVARSNFQKTARAIRTRTGTARARHHPALQSASAEGAHRAAGGPDGTTDPGGRGHWLFWIKHNRDFRACVAEWAYGRPDYPR